MNWNETLRNNVTRAQELKTYMRLTSQEEEHMTRILEQFPMTVTRYYLSLIDWNNPEQDPVFRMSIPSIRETDLSGDFDTSGEADNTVLPGLQHKYRQTALILSTHRCAMYCRHCFRKRLVGIPGGETAGNVDQMAAYIVSHPEITNVLISGGDSFLNSNQIIRRYLEAFSSIKHLDLIRFGTRTPVVLPMRIYDDPELLDILARYTKIKQIYVVTQFNHSNELTPQAVKAIRCLMDAGVIVKNQTVLLKGINDDAGSLGTLLKNLTRYGVIPYYIFQCRPVSGVKSQFQIPLTEGCRIVEEAKTCRTARANASATPCPTSPAKSKSWAKCPTKTCFLNIIRQNMKKTRAVYSARNWHLDRRGCRGDTRLCRRLFPGPCRTLPQANVKPRDIP